jgi:hypothetical protein
MYAEPAATADDPRDDDSNGDTFNPELVVALPYADIYSYYGFTPFWGMEYVTPYFHRR